MRRGIFSTAAWLLALLVLAGAIVAAGSSRQNPKPSTMSQSAALYPRVIPVDTNPCSSGACW